MQVLTASEARVMELVAAGLSNAAIAQRLFLSRRTVESHLHSILMKLNIHDSPGVNRRVCAVLAYFEQARGARPIW